MARSLACESTARLPIVHPDRRKWFMTRNPDDERDEHPIVHSDSVPKSQVLALLHVSDNNACGSILDKIPACVR